MSNKKVMIIGSGPNRIGQGVEFDYCCVHASFALKEQGVTTIMYNCNPETVSTDYDTSDILYFEPIDIEHVRNVIDREKPDGIIIHFGGQTPLKLAKAITKIGGNIIGTSADVIDLAEDRERFVKFIDKHGLKQAPNGTAFSEEKAYIIAEKIGYPVLVRPSYVLGGRAMRIVYSQEELKKYIKQATNVSNNSPVLIDRFLDRAIEIDVDAICDGDEVYIGAIMQHIEEAGVHSGDSACSLPPISLTDAIKNEIYEQTKVIALNLQVIGMLNIQFAIFQGEVYLIEVNPRASRTVPFVSKSTGIPLAKVATLVMLGKTLKEALDIYDKNKIVFAHNGVLMPKELGHISVKEAMFPFSKLEADSTLSPEMKSTGEVMGISESFGESFAKSQIASKNNLPLEGNVFLSLADIDKPFAYEIADSLIKLGFVIHATTGTYNLLIEKGLSVQKALKVSEGRPNIIDELTNKKIQLVINTTDSVNSKNDAFNIRQSVIKNNIAYFTTISAALVVAEAIGKLKELNHDLSVKSIQEYLHIS